MVFPPWFPVTIWSSQAHAAPDLLEFALTVRNIMEPLPRIPRPILPDLHAGRSQPTNGTTNGPIRFLLLPVGYIHLVKNTWWMQLLMIWWFDVWFFWIQKRVNTTVEGFKCGNRVLGQIAGISMGVQIGISRDCGIHRLLALLSLTMPQTSLLPKKILA